MPGEKNVVNHPLFLPEKIYLPYLHIKLDLMKIFVQSLDKTDRRICDEYIPKCE